MENNLTVADMIHNGRWQWPNDWNQLFTELLNVVVPFLQEWVADEVLWKSNNGILSKFSAETAWEDMRTRGENVKWNNLIWYSQGIPRHSFILWLPIKERLQTQDRMLLWSSNVNMVCPLCSKCNDSHSHLSFNCDYSKEVWMVMTEMPCTNNIISEVLGKIVLSTCVYFIWRERNARLFTTEKKNTNGMIKDIEDSVKLKLMNIKVKNYVQVRAMAEEWGIQMNIQN